MADSTDTTETTETKDQAMVPVAEKIAMRQRAQRAEEELAKLQDSGRVLTADQFTQYETDRDAAAKAAEAALIKAKDFDAVRAEDQRKAQAKVDALAEQNAKLLTNMAQRDVDAAIRNELGRAKVVEVEDALVLVKSRLKIQTDPTGVQPPTVLDANGQTMLNDTGDPVTVAAATKTWIESDSGARFLPPSGDTGSGTYNSGGKSGQSFAEIDATPASRQAFITKHGKAEYTNRYYADRNARMAAKANEK